MKSSKFVCAARQHTQYILALFCWRADSRNDANGWNNFTFTIFKGAVAKACILAGIFTK